MSYVTASPSTAAEREMERAQAALRSAERAAERAMERIARIEARPDEPVTDDPDGALVVWFERNFGSAKTYTYAMVKASDGLWYTTGPNSPKGYTWEQVMSWLDDGLIGNLWVATEYTPL